MAANPELLRIWTRGWALTRGVAAPVRDGAAWRIEVGSPDQVRRFVFDDLVPEVVDRAETITEPSVMLKVCTEPQRLVACLPPRWTLRPPGFFMQIDRPMPGPVATPGYAVQLRQEGPITFCRLSSLEGQMAAEGRAVRVEDRIIYDRILVEPNHRRRGLGRAVMHGLQAAIDPDRPGLLVATGEGRALYETLGWSLHSPYATAVIEA